MRRIAGTFLLFASAVLLALVAYAWRRSHRVSDGVTWAGPTETSEVASYAGALHVRGERPALPTFPSRAPTRTRSTEPVPARATWHGRRPFHAHVVWARGGFVYASGTETQVLVPTATSAQSSGTTTVYSGTLTPADPAVPETASAITTTSSGMLTKTGSGTLTMGGGGLLLWPMTTHQLVVVPYWAVAAVVGWPVGWFVLTLPWRVWAGCRRRNEEA